MRGVGINPTRDQHPASRIRVANAEAARSARAQHFGERDARCPSDSATVGGDRDQCPGDPSDRHAPDVGGNHVDSAVPGHDDSLDSDAAGNTGQRSGRAVGGRLRSVRQPCNPHSFFDVPAQRPARASSPEVMRRVQGAQPTEPYPSNSRGFTST
jgi:hypothetical protein